MSRTLSEMVGVRKRAAQDGLFSLLGYDFNAKRTRAENEAEPEKELRSQMDESPVKLKSNSEDDLLCAWKLKAIEYTAYSVWKVNSGW